MQPWVRAAAGMFAVGWGANQFTSLLLAYRAEAGVSVATADALFGGYAIGLIPVLLIAGPLSDRVGRRAMGRVAIVLSVVATAVLALGSDATGWLYLGRLLAGVASGAVFAPGTAWVKELSTPPFAPPGAEDSGARRAAIALSAGFGMGPLVAGLLSQWAPDPLVVPYLAHVAVALAAAALMWRAPETVIHRQPSVLARIRVTLDPRFRRVVMPLAPWVFTAAAISMTIGPALVTDHTGSIRIGFAAIIAGVTLATGVLVQPLARRFDRPGDVRAMAFGLSSCLLGAVIETFTAVTAQPLLALAAAVALGAGYGFCLVAGLLETQRIARPDQLAALTAVYYALTYLGFAAPLVLTSLVTLAPYWVLLLVVAGLAALTLLVVTRNAVRGRAGPLPVS